MALRRQAIVYNTIVFATWTVTSFLCHYCAKAFLTSNMKFSQNKDGGAMINVWSANVITLVQMALCYLCVDVNYSRDGPYLNTARIMHFLATLATNLSMAMMFASSTFAIKLMEPITSAFTQYCTLGTPLSPIAVLSLPIIVGGAIAFSGNPFTDTSLSFGIAAAFASNIILAFRNLAIKKMDSGDKSALTLRFHRSEAPVIVPTVLGAWIIMSFFEKAEFLPTGVTYTAVMCFLSGVFHVTYSYVSTGLVLSQLSVVSHAVANIMKRVLVVLLLYGFGRRVATPYNFLGLVVCTVGLLLYAWDKQNQGLSKTGNISSEKSRKPLHIPRKFVLLMPCLIISVWSVTQVYPPSQAAAGTLRSFRMFKPNEPYLDTDISLADLTFGARSLQHPESLELEPDLTGYLSNQTKKIKQFLQKRMIEDPSGSSFLSKQLKTSLEVTKEAQRIHYNMFKDAIGKFKYCMLLDTADFENKGDPAITVGEFYFLARSNITIIYYCSTNGCTDENLDKAAAIARSYSREELVILNHGGGNLNGYAVHDQFRFKIFKKFSGFQLFVFPQSIWLENDTSRHFNRCRQAYCCNKNLTIVLRDEQSYSLAKKYFSGSSALLMAPDMAFHIGPVKRFMSPVFDIMWIKRNDHESPGYSKIPKHPPHLRLHVSDWHKFRTPKSGTSLEKSFYATVMGLFFAQRGRVIITDRIHGHIFATLLNIPHVLLDNKVKKLSSYHNSWTRGVENTRLTDNPRDALKLALELLEIYKDEIPPRAPGLDIGEYFKNINYSLPERDFP